MVHLSIIALFVCSASVSFGVVVATNPFGNTNAPTGIGSEPTDPGFNYVGQVNGSTGIYLGNGWVLTANHVGAGNFYLGSTTYNYDGSSSYQIGGVDLRLFKLSTSPGLVPLKISTATPSVNDEVVMIGAGRTPTNSSPTTWYVDTGPETWVWQTSDFSEADALASGFTTNSTKVVRWGTNMVEVIAPALTYSGYAPMDMIVTEFDQVGGTPYEAQAVLNDSGGGLFIYNGSSWELSGTIVTVQNFNNQPGGSSSAIFGNLTYSIDLSQHASEIEDYFLAPIPEPAAFSFIVGWGALGLCFSRRRFSTQSKTPGCRRSL